jgi:aminopeptidase N
MKYIFSICTIIVFFSSAAFAQLSDSIHVVRYEITIDTIDFTAKSIRANTKIDAVAWVNGVTAIPLMLLKMQVDSVKSGSAHLTYSYNDTVLRVNCPAPLNLIDSLSVAVYYKGVPKQDASGWGGMYFSGGYMFNMGVGFSADPHSYGRVWFPCIDEFTSRSRYVFNVTTSDQHKAFCNGILTGEVNNGNGTKTWTWTMYQDIPAYLASIAVAPFYTLERISNGFPVQWAVLSADTVKTLSSFVNLDTVLSKYIDSYGPYLWDKVGYVAIPFNSGAMEHATSIHIGKGYLDGTLNYETLWAHELSHHWWGDLVTCETEGDMWLNEGWASFSESLMKEAVYGKTAYKDYVRSNHKKVLQFAHINDGSYFSMINIPHAYTYGTTVYNKGADVAHTIRGYMGDAKFFQGCKDYMNTFAFGTANSYDLRDALTASSGINMDRFFDDWVFNPGFPHFSIDSVKSVPNSGSYDVTVYTRQRRKGTTRSYRMNVECNFTNGVKDTTALLDIDTTLNAFQFRLSFDPAWVSLDRDEKMSDAVTDYERKIVSLGNQTMPETYVALNISDTGAYSGTSVRIEHNWVAPDSLKRSNPGIRLSDYRYWKVDGIFAPGFLSKAIFSYDGSTSLSSGYLDNTLITKEDSLVILYRSGTGDDWQPVKGYVHNKGTPTDKRGSFTVDTLKKGEYTLGIYDYKVGMAEAKNEFENKITVSPNPVSGVCRISFNLPQGKNSVLKIFNITGQCIYKVPVFSHQEFVMWDTWQVPKGIYFVSLDGEGTSAKIAVE